MMASGNAVFITPIVTRASDGLEVPELGAGGGKGDLYQNHELELPDESTVQQLEKLCLEQIQDNKVLSQTKEALISAFKSKKRTLSLDEYGLKDDSDISLSELVAIISHGQKDRIEVSRHAGNSTLAGVRGEGGRELPRTIVSFFSLICVSAFVRQKMANTQCKQFPYSRHSSYSELCEFISAFKPKDIHPCTVDPETWSEEVSMKSLFGHLCSGEDFLHDRCMREMLGQIESRPSKRVRAGSSFVTSSQQSSIAHQGMDDDDDSEHIAPGEDIGRIHQEKYVESMTSGDTDDIQPAPQRASVETSSTEIFSDSYLESEDNMQDKIRDVREYLEGMKDQMLFTNGPLPAHMQEEPGTTEQSKKKEQEMGQEYNSQKSIISVSLPGASAVDPSSQSNNSDFATDPENRLSIPISLFESQDPNNHGLKHEQLVAIPNIDGSNDMFYAGASDPSSSNKEPTVAAAIFNHPGRSDNSSSSAIALKNRLRAYHAARAGTFDAWSKVALMSAGNNHTEEEVEL